MEDLFLIDQSHQDLPVDTKFNDLVVDNYDLVVIDGPARKLQDLIKILLSQQGLNLIYPSYGTLLSQAPGTRGTSELNDLISESITEALGWLQKQELSGRADERISKIVSLSVSNGPTSQEKRINLVVELENGMPLTTNFPVSTRG